METLTDNKTLELIGKYTDYDLDFINLFNTFPEEQNCGYAYFRIQRDENDRDLFAIFSQMSISRLNLQDGLMMLMQKDIRWKDAVERALISYLFQNKQEIEDVQQLLDKLKEYIKTK